MGDGKKSQVNVVGIICTSGGYQDLLPGFYQGFTLNSVRNFRCQRDKPTRKLLEKVRTKQKNIIQIPACSFV